MQCQQIYCQQFTQSQQQRRWQVVASTDHAMSTNHSVTTTPVASIVSIIPQQITQRQQQRRWRAGGKDVASTNHATSTNYSVNNIAGCEYGIIASNAPWQGILYVASTNLRCVDKF